MAEGKYQMFEPDKSGRSIADRSEEYHITLPSKEQIKNLKELRRIKQDILYHKHGFPSRDIEVAEQKLYDATFCLLEFANSYAEHDSIGVADGLALEGRVGSRFLERYLKQYPDSKISNVDIKNLKNMWETYKKIIGLNRKRTQEGY